jgi:hypothetical protein
MAAPKGNKFWLTRSSHGRKTIFKTPTALQNAAGEYFLWCEKHPWNKNEAIKSGPNAGKIIKVPTERPFTLTGMCQFLNVNSDYFNQFKKRIAGKTDKKSVGFAEVITRIEETIYTQKFEGAAVGAFTPNIIARDLGLVDKKDVTTDGESMNKGYYEFLKQRRTQKSKPE